MLEQFNNNLTSNTTVTTTNTNTNTNTDIDTNTNTNTNTEATPQEAVEYITNALTDHKLYMQTACKKLGWSFPRIRSRARTIAKNLNCTFTKVTRGVYVLEPIENSGTSDESVTNETTTDEVTTNGTVNNAISTGTDIEEPTSIDEDIDTLPLNEDI